MKTTLTLIGGICFVAMLVFVNAIAFAHGGDSDLIHTCVNKQTGLMRRIKPQKECRSFEKPLDWNSSNWSSYVVYDANNKRIGDVTEFAGGVDPIVMLRSGGRHFRVRVLPDRFESAPREGQDSSIRFSQLYFESDDCTGSGYVPLDNTALLPVALAVSTWNAVFVQVEGSHPIDRAFLSSWNTYQQYCENDDGEQILLSVPTERIDLSAVFTPPYRLKVNARVTDVSP